MRSVDLFFCLRMKLTISSLSDGGGEGRKMNFPLLLLGNTMEKYLNEEYRHQDWRQCLKNSSSMDVGSLIEEPL